jgi:tRNA A37 methylthiotransferase MiaB
MIWKVEEILISGKKEWQFFGRTRNFKEVFFKKKENIKIWDIVKVKITKLNRYVLEWEII